MKILAFISVRQIILTYLSSLGPKLFKEPSSKSNKPIIHNAISHCCLAGKVNEPHKNSILEVNIKIIHALSITWVCNADFIIPLLCSVNSISYSVAGESIFCFPRGNHDSIFTVYLLRTLFRVLLLGL